MRRLGPVSLGVFLVAAMTLMVEILLIRVFDVILEGHIGYIVVTCAMFALGFAGALSAIWPMGDGQDPGSRAAYLTVLLALVVVLIRPLLNGAPEIYQALEPKVLRYLVGIAIIYGAVMLPFFLSGMIFAYVFSAGASRIGRLYFFDLAGAALGCIIWIPFIRYQGPGGLMIWAAGILILAAALFAGRRSWWIGGAVVAAMLFLAPSLLGNARLDFMEHQNKRGVLAARKADRVEFTEWDPVSKIYVIETASSPKSNELLPPSPKHVAYDGGSQSSHFFPFDGRWEVLRKSIVEGQVPTGEHFWRRGLLASHYLKRDTGARVLICGSAAGQETKAALLFGASHVDGIELVDTVVRLGKGPYSNFIGDIFNDPRVHNRRGEARSFLRSTQSTYDIIQIFSNHTSSHIATGSGAFTPIYLQTAEAYEEYFTHLKDDGILHINHHFYPRMVTTAALAWKHIGRTDFQRHVLIYQRKGWDTLPTMLIKMTPWTRAEVDEVEEFFAAAAADQHRPERVVNPLDSAESFLPAEFFEGRLPTELVRRLDYRAQPSTDNQPFLGTIQKHFRAVEPDPERFLDASMAGALNGRRNTPGGEYGIFIGPGIVGLVYAAVLIILPLLFSPAGRTPWTARQVALLYFSCLGLAFIIVELVFIQLFMKLIGFPVYAYAVVILAMLLSAALGSLSVGRLRVDRERWVLPFTGIVILGSIAILVYSRVFDPLLAHSMPMRAAAAFALIFPVGFFMGMPFPMGILRIRNQPHGAVAWAWGANGVFTVIGGILSGVLAQWVGFQLTMAFAIGIYVVAWLAFATLRLRTGQPAGTPGIAN